METPIRITAEVQQHDRSTCKFMVDRPLHTGLLVRFTSRDQAQGSPLAERLFALDGVRAVAVHDQEVLVSKQGPVDWRTAGPAVGTAIREHLQSGQPAVGPDALARMGGDDQLRSRIQRILDEQINPAVASHGGYITLLDVQQGKVLIRMGGGCQGCGMANVTLREGIEAALREQVPEITEILDVTEHTEGTNPYYAAH